MRVLQVVVFEGRGTSVKKMWLIKEDVGFGEIEKRPKIIITEGGKKDFTGKYKYYETVSSASERAAVLLQRRLRNSCG